MKFASFCILFLIFLLVSCEGEKEKSASLESSDSLVLKPTNAPQVLNESSDFKAVMSQIKFRKVPLVDSTNFDNIERVNLYDQKELNLLQVEKIYPHYYEETAYYKSKSNYRIKFSDDFYSIVLITFKGEHEIVSTLINYNLNGDLIDYKTISYDEIAEGWSRIESRIDRNIITRTSTLWLDTKEETVEKFKVGANGKIKQL